MLIESGRESSQRLAKVLAHAGLCSRREAEQWILQGRVIVDGSLVQTLGSCVTPHQKICIDGQPLPAPSSPRLWKYYKPPQTLVTNALTTDRENVFEHIKRTLPPALFESLPRLVSVGRLDFLSEGLLLFSNDGEVTRFLELPSTGWKRKYRVRVFGTVTDKALQGLAKGVTVQGMTYGPIQAFRDLGPASTKSNTWITMTLCEGKNREIRRIAEHLGWRVSRLIRLSYGPFSLESLKSGQLIEVPRKILKASLSQDLRKKF